MKFVLATMLCLVIAAASISGCTGTAKTAQLTGSVTYRTRIALPPEAVITVRLEDTTHQDVGATQIAEFTDVAKGRQVPIPFTISYDPARIEPGHTYSLRATIHDGDRRAFMTTSSYPVLTNGATSDVALNLDHVGESPSDDSSQSTASLENTYWKAIRLAGHEIVVPERTREPHFVLHAEEHRVAGTGGCNRFFGNYTTSGDALTVSDLGATLMACAEPAMTQEKWLADVLSQATTWRITGEQLELLRDGTVIGTFVSVYLK